MQSLLVYFMSPSLVTPLVLACLLTISLSSRIQIIKANLSAADIYCVIKATQNVFKYITLYCLYNYYMHILYMPVQLKHNVYSTYIMYE